MKKKIAVIASIMLLDVFVVFSCFWDYDTIEMERQQFPSVIELISGHFLRHSPEFHYWRIKHKEAQLMEHPDSLVLYDDIAVSYSKTGDNNKAIALMQKKDSISPGRYETYANMGTFYLHNAKLRQGIKYIKKAITINPSAHFGREKYQMYLAEYVLSKQKGSKIELPLSVHFRRSIDGYPRPEMSDNFYAFLLRKHFGKQQQESNKSRKLPKEVLDDAVIGVMGMLKFGNYNSPILLEILGDLLMGSGWYEGARNLAGRAYMKASYEVSNTEIKELYRKKAFYALFHQYTKRGGRQFSLDDFEKLFKAELETGENYYSTLRNDEINWIKNADNPELKFAQKYYETPKVPKRKQLSTSRPSRVYVHLPIKHIRVDLRPTLVHQIALDADFKHLVDSMYQRKLQIEDFEIAPTETESTANVEQGIVPIGNDDSSIYRLVGTVVVFLLLVVLVVRKYISVRRKNDR